VRPRQISNRRIEEPQLEESKIRDRIQIIGRTKFINLLYQKEELTV